MARKVAAEVLEISADVNKAIDAVGRVGKEVEKLGDKTEKNSRKINKYNRAMRRAGQATNTFKRSLQFLGFAAFTYQLNQAVQAGLEYDRALTNVAKTTNITGPGLEKLSDNLTDLSNALGTSSTALANITGIAGQLGVRGTEDLSKFTEVVSKLTLATDLSEQSASFAFARVMKLTDSNISQQFEQLASVMVELGNTTVTTESRIASFMETLTPVLRLQGYNPTDIAGISAAAASVGLEEAMTRTSLLRMGAKFDEVSQMELDDPQLKMVADVMQVEPDRARYLLNKDRAHAMSEFYSNLGELSNARQVLEALGFTDIRTHNVAYAMGSPMTREAVLRAREEYANPDAFQEEIDRYLQSDQGRWLRAGTRISNFKRAIGQEIVSNNVGLYEAISKPFGAALGGEDAVDYYEDAFGLSEKYPQQADLIKRLHEHGSAGSREIASLLSGMLAGQEMIIGDYPKGTSVEDILAAEAKEGSAMMAISTPQGEMMVPSGTVEGSLTQLVDSIGDLTERAEKILAATPVNTPEGAVGMTGVYAGKRREAFIPSKEEAEGESAAADQREALREELAGRTRLDWLGIYAESGVDPLDYSTLAFRGTQQNSQSRRELQEIISREAAARRRQAYEASQARAVSLPQRDDDGFILPQGASLAPAAYGEYAAQSKQIELANKEAKRLEDQALFEHEEIQRYQEEKQREEDLFEARVRYYEQMKEGWVSVGDTFAVGIANMITGVNDLRDVFGNMIRHIQQQVLQQMVVNPISNYVGGILGGVVDGAIGSPVERAAGGGIGALVDRAVKKGEDKGFFGTIDSILTGEFFDNSSGSEKLWDQMMSQSKGSTGKIVQTKGTPGWLEGLNTFAKVMGFGNSVAGLGGGASAPSIPNVPGGAYSTTGVGRAFAGGTVRAEGLTLVGEQGPEMLSLPKGARIEPLAGSGGGAAGNVVMNLNVNGVQDPTVVRRQVMAMMPEMSQQLQKDIILNSQGNTEMAQAFGR